MNETLTVSLFSSAGAQPISLKSFRGLGHFPNKIARVYKHEHCLPSAFRSWQVMRSGYRCALLAGMASSGGGYSPDLLVGYIPVDELLKAEQA